MTDRQQIGKKVQLPPEPTHIERPYQDWRLAAINGTMAIIALLYFSIARDVWWIFAISLPLCIYSSIDCYISIGEKKCWDAYHAELDRQWNEITARRSQ